MMNCHSVVGRLKSKKRSSLIKDRSFKSLMTKNRFRAGIQRIHGARNIAQTFINKLPIVTTQTERDGDVYCSHEFKQRRCRPKWSILAMSEKLF